MAIAVVIVLATAACGKKGPPLLPFVRQPAAADVTSALRIGDDVFVTVSVPTANVDGSAPASVKEIEVWGATAATPPSQSQFTAIGAVVARIPVARYADPADRSGTVVPDPATGALQGASVTILDSLTEDEMKPSFAKASASATSGREATRQAALSGRSAPQTDAADKTGGKPEAAKAAAPDPEALRRYYMTIPVSDRKRPGQPSKLVDVPLTSVPDGVTSVGARMDGRKVVVEWQPSGGLFGFLVGRALPVEPAPVGERVAPTSGPASAASASGPVLYNVYRELSPDPLALPVREAAGSPWASNPQSPLNPQPLTLLRFEEEVPFDERRRCYYVRAVRGSGAQRVESQTSSRACVIPVDTEAPAAVTSLSATVVEGEITLRWDPNGEEDLRGYIVLRRGAGDDTLQQLTRNGPIARTTYTDSTVTAGQMYTYVVRAVDSRIPVPNVSDPEEISAAAR